jgi:hypothetical protein
MSRTYHHGDRAKQRLYGHRRCVDDGRVYPKRKKHHCHWRWWMANPSWYRHEFQTVPQRAQTRNLISKTMKLYDMEDYPIFPHPTKPEKYYY